MKIRTFKSGGRPWSLLLLILLAALPGACQETQGSEAADPEKPNVLFIAVDDLNYWTVTEASPIRTPNIRRLAERGVLFTHAYAPAPACAPSRTAIMWGLRPSTTSVYSNHSDWRKAPVNDGSGRTLAEAKTISEYFMAHGYRAEGAGKIFHHGHDGAFHPEGSFHQFLPLPDDPMPEEKLNGLDEDDMVGWNGSPNYDWGPLPKDPSKAPDVKTVNWVIDALKRQGDEPFFLAAGIFRPHSPWFAPPEYFEQYPLDGLVMPTVLENDVDDIPSGGQVFLGEKGKGYLFKTMQANDAWHEAVRAYYATATFADAQIGRLLDALYASPHADNTIVILWSDHGFHLGEKGHWEKFALWEKTTRVPFIIVAPGVTQPGTMCDEPVSLIDIYPTLIDLAGLPPNPALDGQSLVPFLKNPEVERERPAVMTYLQGNHAVRSDRWRYIHYSDGTEELYDHENDPHEWYNLAGDPRYEDIIEELKKWLPEENAEPVPRMVDR